MISTPHKLPEDLKQAVTDLHKRLAVVEQEQDRQGTMLTLRSITIPPGRSLFKD